MRRVGPALLTLLLTVMTLWLPLVGCHSAMIQATVHNGTGLPLQLIEVDYPSASFGTQGLAAGADFKYRFKVLGSGELKILYTDKSGKEKTGTGPELHEGLEGQLLIDVSDAGVHWIPKLTDAP